MKEHPAQKYLFKDSDGKPSISYSMLIITFVILTLWLLLSIFQKVMGIEIRPFDPAGASLWFSPIATLYFSRRWGSTKVDETKTE